MKKGAIFDMDGLLFDTEVVYNKSWYEVADRYDLPIHEEMLDQLRGTNGVIMNDIINSYLPDVDGTKLIEDVFACAKKTLAQHVPMKDGALEVLSYFKEKKVKLAVASSAPIDLIINNLKKAEIDFYFDAIVSGQQVSKGKPNPDIFLLAANKLMLNSSDCYVFEDGIHGVEAGVRAGCSTIMIPDLLEPTEKERRDCCAIFTSLLEVIDAIEQGQM